MSRIHLDQFLSRAARMCPDRTGKIAGYKWPQSIEFRDEPFPISGTGKVLKRELRARYWTQQDRNVNK